MSSSTGRFDKLAASPVRLIGVLGGIGSGKSTATRVLGELGAHVFDADLVAHEILARDDVRSAVRERWGEEVLAPDGSVDRARLARRVFQDEDERRALEAIVHSHVFDALERCVASLEHATGDRMSPPLLVLDAALIAETGLIAACKYRIFVDTPFEIRRRRTVEERAWDAEDLARREAHQMSLEAKRALADVVVDGSAGLDRMRGQIREFLERQLGWTPPAR